MLSPTAWTMLAILVAMFGLLVSNRLPVWLVFIGTLTVAMTLKLAPAAALLKGFSNTGVLTVAALYPVAAGMYATGAISLLAERLIGLPRSLRTAQVKILAPVSLTSAFFYNTPLVAMMIPAVRDVTRRTTLQGSKLFMGLSYLAILGGTITLIGTSVNLIIAGLVSDAIAKGELVGMKSIGLFDPMWIGLPATAAGLVFMSFIGSRLLPDRNRAGDAAQKRMYRGEFLIEEGSNLPGKTLEQAGFARPIGGCCLQSLRRRGALIELASGVKLE